MKELEEIYEIEREKLTSDVLGFLGELEKKKTLIKSLFNKLEEKKKD